MKKHQKTPWTMLVLSAIVLAFVLGFGAFVVLSAPVNPGNQETQRFVVPKGRAINTIGKDLQEAGLIKNWLVFRLVVMKDDLANKIQAGSFDLSPNMSVGEIANRLTEGTNDLWVTIPEGWRREEIAQSLSEQELDNFSSKEFLQLTQGEEGRLFPDTYLIPREISTQQVATLLEQTFERKVISGLASEIASSPYSLDEALVMASIVEREASGLEEMKMVAGILWNRQENGIALNADATLQYIKGYNQEKDSWWIPPMVADKKLNSPYNTYLYAGLPPAPIANPGLDAIKAALHPANTNYLYYLHDSSGQIHYAATLDEHNANVDKYIR